MYYFMMVSRKSVKKFTELEQQGYKFVTISELLEIQRLNKRREIINAHGAYSIKQGHSFKSDPVYCSR